MRAFPEISIDLSAQDLLSLPAPTAMVEVDDICAFDPLPHALPQRRTYRAQPHSTTRWKSS